MKNILKKIQHALRRKAKKAEMDKLLASGLPKEMQPALDYLITGRCDQETIAVATKAEARRAQIAAGGQTKVPIWYSPKPGSASVEDGGKVEPGEVIEFTMERIAKTGKDRKWGTVLHLIAKEFRSTCGFELGACAGISAMYLSSVPSMEKFVTVEGSEALAQIAQASLRNYPNAEVVNQLFDDAIDMRAPDLAGQLDLAYIDGHHEKVATIHYFDKLLPYLKEGAIVLFDDISWSYDMKAAWDLLRMRPEFSMAMDLGTIGLCVLKKSSSPREISPDQWDLQVIVGRQAIGNPHGWQTVG